eukprot:scaffold56325_cov32-Prasinocladus_malaysianus.AAC.1
MASLAKTRPLDRYLCISAAASLSTAASLAGCRAALRARRAVSSAPGGSRPRTARQASAFRAACLSDRTAGLRGASLGEQNERWSSTCAARWCHDCEPKPIPVTLSADSLERIKKSLLAEK